MDGFTACKLLKEDEDTRPIPIIIMTALDRVEDRIQGIEAGADDFLTKPVNDRELLARIQTALKMKAERDVSVLMLDVSGCSRLSEQLPTTQLNDLVERYFSAFLDRIREADGDINETAGDGFMALFMDAEDGAPEDGPSHVVRAVDTTLDLLTTTQRLNAEIAQTPLGVHIGTNSGPALVGSTRFEDARGTRWTFTASGTVTNIAARLVGVASDGQIVIGPQIRQGVGDRYELESVGEKQLKNLSEPIEVHRVLGPA